MNHFDRCTLLGSYHLPKMFEKIMFHCFQEGQKGSNWAQYIVPWPNTKQPLQNMLNTINTASNTVSGDQNRQNIEILLWVNHMKPLKNTPNRYSHQAKSENGRSQRLIMFKLDGHESGRSLSVKVHKVIDAPVHFFLKGRPFYRFIMDNLTKNDRSRMVVFPNFRALNPN